MAKKPPNGHAKRAKKHDALRDEIAVQAMQALISSRGFAASADPGAAAMLARSAYAIADALIAERAHRVATEED